MISVQSKVKYQHREFVDFLGHQWNQKQGMVDNNGGRPISGDGGGKREITRTSAGRR